MDGFSSGLRLTGLDDRITPSQSCIKPVPKATSDGGGLRATIELEDDGTYVEVVGADRNVLDKATISLNDCLACSGCITSAESVLIEQQSSKQFFSHLSSRGDQTFVVTLSPQARASIASHYQLTAIQTHKKLTSYFKQMGCHYLFDSSFSREFTLVETLAEFVHRYKNGGTLPLLTSACPGWVCYAEKKHGDFILPYISTAKSPQQVMGTLVKTHFASTLGKKPSDIYHISIMPCFDKKLEASRSDFITPFGASESTGKDAAERGDGVPDVDCVLTSMEIVEMIKEAGIDFVNLPDAPLDHMFTLSQMDELHGREGVSGGYVDFVLEGAARTLFPGEGDVTTTRTIRNADFHSVELSVGGECKLVFTTAYGFNNIQNVVRRLKSTKAVDGAPARRRKRSRKPAKPMHFVEIMACPSGCTNGGGQVRPEGGREEAKEALARVNKVYSTSDKGMPEPPETSESIRELYKEWVKGEAYSENAKEVLHTQYHAVEPMDTGALQTTW